MATTFTAAINLGKPARGDSSWDSVMNTNMDNIDALFPATRTNQAILSFNASGNIVIDGSNFIWDNTNGTVMIGATTTVAKRLFIRRGTNAESTGQPAGNWTAILFNATNAASENGMLIKINRFVTDAVAFEIGDDTPGGAYQRYFQVDSGGATEITFSGLLVGPATGGNKGQGTVNVSVNIFKNNTAYNNPAYAIEHWVKGKIEKFINNEGAADYTGAMPLMELEEYMKENFHLPRIWEDVPTGIFTRADMALEKLEEIFIHLIDHEKRLLHIETSL